MARTFSSKGHLSTTSEYFEVCMDFLSPATMMKVCKRSQSQIYKYAKDTAHTDESYQNPADMLMDLNARMKKLGRQDVAVDLLRIMADELGCKIVEAAPVVPDKATMAEEIVDDHDVLNTFYNVLKQPPESSRVSLVKALGDDCKREIDENIAKYEEVASDAEK